MKAKRWGLNFSYFYSETFRQFGKMLRCSWGLAHFDLSNMASSAAQFARAAFTAQPPPCSSLQLHRHWTLHKNDFPLSSPLAARQVSLKTPDAYSQRKMPPIFTVNRENAVVQVCSVLCSGSLNETGGFAGSSNRILLEWVQLYVTSRHVF